MSGIVTNYDLCRSYIGTDTVNRIYIGADLIWEAKLLDKYNNAIHAYSIRKLINCYDGPAIRLRVDREDTEHDIGFDANGDLDTQQILDLVGGNTGTIVTWYDQLGTTNITNAVAIQQPHIVQAGILNTSGGKPAIDFAVFGSNYVLNTADAVSISNQVGSYFTVSEPRSSSGSDLGCTIYTAGTTIREIFSNTLNDDIVFPDRLTYVNEQFEGLQTDTDGLNGQYLQTFIRNAGQIDGYSNAQPDVEFTPVTNPVDTITSFAIGETGFPIGAATPKGVPRMQELIIFSDDKNADRLDMEKEINTYYNIYDDNQFTNEFTNEFN